MDDPMFDNEIPVQWYTTIYAPHHYDAYLISGECFWFYTEGARQGLGFWAEAGIGWRAAGVTSSGGSPDSTVKLPLGAQITWLSITEKKYYQATIMLPRERMLAEFAKRFDFEYHKTPNHFKFEKIHFALAPGGFINLRLGGTRTVEVANFQAEEIQVSWEFFARTHHFSPEAYPEAEFLHDYHKKLPPAIKTMVEENNLPLTRWRNYSDKFAWYFAPTIELEGCRIGCVNGNNRFYNKQEIATKEVLNQEYAPAWIKLYYLQAGQRYRTNIRFTEQLLNKSEQPDDDLVVYNEFKDFFSSEQLPTALVLEQVDNGWLAYLTNGSKKQYITITQAVTRETEDSHPLQI